eukprot:Mrub_04338.p1 GENE.Mrub_04338~~Mrub_04338.p1  ORF type:complete len:388 (-),score=20.08 Mrub_04338:125-1288(-)
MKIYSKDLLYANNYIQRNQDFMLNYNPESNLKKKKCHYCHIQLEEKYFNRYNWKRKKGSRYCRNCKYLNEINRNIYDEMYKIKKFSFSFAKYYPYLEKNENMIKIKAPTLLNHGQFRNVYCGIVDSGKIENFIKPSSHIVIKAFKDKYFNQGYRHTLVDYEMQELALTMTNSFENYIRISHSINYYFYYRRSHLYYFTKNVLDTEGKIAFYRNDPLMIESMIHKDYDKYNSNTGYSKGDELMDALSHYSYHKYGMLLCDIQGHKGKHVSKNIPIRHKYGSYYYLLTDPCIHTPERKYGLSDLGSKGISNFFYYHVCSDYCKNLKKPESVAQYYKKEKSTSFEKQLTGLSDVPRRDEYQIEKQLDEIIEENSDENNDSFSNQGSVSSD